MILFVISNVTFNFIVFFPQYLHFSLSEIHKTPKKTRKFHKNAEYVIKNLNEKKTFYKFKIFLQLFYIYKNTNKNIYKHITKYIKKNILN